MLCKIAPYPVANVQGTISAETEDVMRCDILNFARFLEQMELGQNGDRFQKDGEGPNNLEWREAKMEYKRGESRRSDEVLNFEGVMNAVVRMLVAVYHEKNGKCGRRKE